MKENYISRIAESDFFVKETGTDKYGRTDYIRIETNRPDNMYLSVKSLGYEVCDFDKPKRIHTFEANTLHFIARGKGYFDGILLGERDGFMIKKNHTAEYFQDSESPWTYVWINFDGEIADNLLYVAGLTDYKCTFSVKHCTDIINRLINVLNSDFSDVNADRHLNSVLLEILSYMIKDAPETFITDNMLSVMENRVKNGIEFIRKHYKEKNCAEKLAEQEKVSMRYLARLFKKYSDNSPQAHVIRIRIEEAKRLLRTTDISISDVAAEVGYDDVMQFSKIFHKHTGVSPTNFRKGSRDTVRHYE